MHHAPGKILQFLHRAATDDPSLERLLDVLEHFAAKLEKALQAGQTIHGAGAVALFGHHTFLPWAKTYREHLIAGRGADDPGFREARAGLGGSSRWLYAKQKANFLQLAHLLTGSRIPDHVLETIWKAFQKLESRLLAASRRRAGSGSRRPR